MTVTPKSLINDSGTVPSLPLIYEEITNTINDPNSSTNSIGDVISKDSGLTARLLRIANSALYNFPSTIDTISQAVIVIGIQQLRDLALGTSVVELFEGIADDLVNMDSFWRHSIACGIAARILATYRREANVERYFVAGVLHDIGRLIIYLKLSEEAREALVRCKGSGELLYKVEKEILGFDHAEVGGGPAGILETSHDTDRIGDLSSSTDAIDALPCGIVRDSCGRFDRQRDAARDERRAPRPSPLFRGLGSAWPFSQRPCAHFK